jgi:hypothetical protein
MGCEKMGGVRFLFRCQRVLSRRGRALITPLAFMFRGQLSLHT